MPSIPWRTRASLVTSRITGRHRGRLGGGAVAIVFGLTVALAFPSVALANVGLTQISSDPFTQATCTASNTTYHHTEVEPDTFSNGSTIVSAFQVARIFDGGACAIGFATSTNNGATWTSGIVPGITKWTAVARSTAPPMSRRL